MTFLFVLLTFAVLVVVELIRTSRHKAVAIRESGSHRAGMPSPPDSYERYYHPAHSWVLVRNRNVVTVGADDFAQRLIGPIESVQLPQRGSFIHQGEPYAVLKRGSRSLIQIAPLTGVVTEANSALRQEPSAVNRSPLDEGWLLRVAPMNLSLELNNLLRGVSAERWREAIRSHLVQWFSPAPAPVFQDGGEIVANVGALLSDDDWNRLVHEFFPYNDASKKTILKPLT